MWHFIIDLGQRPHSRNKRETSRLAKLTVAILIDQKPMIFFCDKVHKPIINRKESKGVRSKLFKLEDSIKHKHSIPIIIAVIIRIFAVDFTVSKDSYPIIGSVPINRVLFCLISS